MTKNHSCFPAFFLALSLFLPTPAHALRVQNGGLEEQTKTVHELDWALRGNNFGTPITTAGSEEGTTVFLEPTGTLEISIKITDLNKLEGPLDVIWGGGSVGLQVIPDLKTSDMVQITLWMNLEGQPTAAGQPFSLSPGHVFATGRTRDNQNYTGIVVPETQLNQLPRTMDVTRVVSNTAGNLTVRVVGNASKTMVHYKTNTTPTESAPASPPTALKNAQQLLTKSRRADGSLNILCLCSGNLWRSAALHMTLEHALTQQGLPKVTIQSGGTLLWSSGGFQMGNIVEGITAALGTQLLSLPQAQKLLLAIALDNPSLLDQEGPLRPEQAVSAEQLWQFYQRFDPALWRERIENSKRLQQDNSRQAAYERILAYLAQGMTHFDLALEKQGSQILSTSFGRNTLLEITASQRGIDDETIRRFSSKPVTRGMVMKADVIVVADEANRQYLEELFPATAKKMMLFTELVPGAFPGLTDMPDPQNAANPTEQQQVLETMFSAVQRSVNEVIVPLLSAKNSPSAAGLEERLAGEFSRWLKGAQKKFRYFHGDALREATRLEQRESNSRTETGYLRSLEHTDRVAMPIVMIEKIVRETLLKARRFVIQEPDLYLAKGMVDDALQDLRLHKRFLDEAGLLHHASSADYDLMLPAGETAGTYQAWLRQIEQELQQWSQRLSQLETGLEESAREEARLNPTARLALLDQVQAYLRDLSQAGVTIQVLDPEMIRQYPALAVLTEISDSILVDRGEETLRDLRNRETSWVDYYGLAVNAARFDEKASGITVMIHEPGDESFVQFLVGLLHAMAPLKLASQAETEQLAAQLLRLAA